MKRFAVAFFVMAFFLSNLAAHAAGATFATRRGEIFQLFLNGQLVNGRGSSQVTVDRLPAGLHTVEFRLPARRGFLTFCTKVGLDRGFITNFILVPPGPQPQFFLKRVNRLRLVAPVCHNCPPPRPHGHDPYDDYDYRDQPGNGNNYQNNQGNNYGNQNGGYGNQNGNYGNQNGNYGNNYNGNNPNGGNAYGNPPANPNPTPAYLSRYDVDQLLDSMKKQSFEGSKLDIAKQAVGNNAVLAEDVKRIMSAFHFENSRLDFAKFAYPHLYDPQNFYRVYDAFEFETSITDMERWLKK